MSSQTIAPARSIIDQLGRIDQQEPCFVANGRQSTVLHKLNMRQPGRITQGILRTAGAALQIDAMTMILMITMILMR